MLVVKLDRPAGIIFEQVSNRTHNGPIGRKTRGYILTPDQSDAIRVGIFSRRTNQTQDARVHSHVGPIRRKTRGYLSTGRRGFSSSRSVTGPYTVS
eukprot:2795197-Pyramimonas_sp.AAC.2